MLLPLQRRRKRNAQEFEVSSQGLKGVNERSKELPTDRTFVHTHTHPDRPMIRCELHGPAFAVAVSLNDVLKLAAGGWPGWVESAVTLAKEAAPRRARSVSQCLRRFPAARVGERSEQCSRGVFLSRWKGTPRVALK